MKVILRWFVCKLHELFMWGHRLRHRRRKSWSEIKLLRQYEESKPKELKP
jgi:hypothetical protein